MHQGALSFACGLALVAACQQPPPPAKAEPAPQPAPTPAPADAPKTVAKVRDDVPLPLTKFLGRPVAEVQAQLGEPPGKGMARPSCVRYLPERVWFRCQYATQRYPDPTGTFDGVELEFEDGVVSSIAFEGWKAGSGPIEPGPLLAAIGLELPDPPRADAPAGGVRRWSWFNSAARLHIGEHQYRVEMSVVDEDWKHSKVAVILNEPLTEAQKAAVLPVGGKKPDPPPPEPKIDVPPPT